MSPLQLGVGTGSWERVPGCSCSSRHLCSCVTSHLCSLHLAFSSHPPESQALSLVLTFADHPHVALSIGPLVLPGLLSVGLWARKGFSVNEQHRLRRTHRQTGPRWQHGSPMRAVSSAGSRRAMERTPNLQGRLEQYRVLEPF